MPRTPSPASGAKTRTRTGFELPDGTGYATAIDLGSRVWIGKIWVHPDKRGHGYATALLEAVIACYPGRMIALSPSPFRLADAEPAGLSGNDLAGWYARHGFRHSGGHHCMTRPPRRPADGARRRGHMPARSTDD